MSKENNPPDEIDTEYLEEEEVLKINTKKDESSSSKVTAKKKANTGGSVPFFQLWQYATRAQISLAIIASIFSIGSGVLRPLVITVVGRILNQVGSSTFFFSLSPPELARYVKDNHISLPDEFQPIILSFVYFGIGMLVSSYASGALWIYISESLSREIRQRYVRSILRQDIGWHDKAEDGSLTTRLSLDTQMIQDGIGDKLGIAQEAVASFITGVIIAYVNGWKLALVMSVCLPLSTFIGVVVVGQIKKYTSRAQSVYARAGAVVEQAFSGIRTVYAFSLQERFAKMYDDRLVDAERFETRRGLVYGTGFGLYFGIQYCVYGLGFWYGSRQVISGELSGANVMVVFFSLFIGCQSLIAIPTCLQAIGQAQSAAYKVFMVINRVPPIDSESNEGTKKEKLSGEIEFKNVDFQYPTRPDVPILKNLSLKISPGQTVAFVGPSGSGKSTSVALVQRLYDVISGEVLVDGQDIREYNLTSLRSHIGLVGQEPVLFNMTIKQNILMGTVNPIMESRLIEVCKMANCHNFISLLPQGYDTNVGEHGGMLSGGQKQRIAIARALIKDPQILLLDEATSALDTASERVVQRALDAASQNRTTIHAHRLSTIKHADLIVVMDKGELVEQGTHNSLYALGGLYHMLVEKQKIEMKEDDHAHEEQEEHFNIPNSSAIVANPQAVVNMGGNELISVPDAVELTKSANTKRLAEKKEVRLKKKTVDRSYTLAVLKLMRPHWPLIILGTLGAALAGVTSPIFAFFLGHEVIKLISPNKSEISPSAFSGANLYAFLFAMVGIAALVGFTLQNVCFDRAGARLTRRLRAETFRTLLRQEVGFYDEEGHTLGALTSRLAKDVADVNLMVGRAWGELAQFIMTIIGGVVICFVTAANLTGIILLITPVAIFASYYRSRTVRGFESDTRKAYEEASEVAAEAIKEIRTVVSLGRQPWFVDRFSSNLEYPYILGISKAYRDSIGFALNGAVAQFTTALAYYAGMRLIQDGHVAFENVYITLMVALLTTQAIGRSSTFSTSLDKGKIGAIKTWEFLERQTAIDPYADGLVSEEFDPTFNFKNVAFTYPARPDQPIFTGEFNVGGKPNHTLALVGASGCGKSTTIGMLERWYDCIGGSVEVGGHNVKEYQLQRGLRHNMALVGQEPVLFDMSIRDNLIWGSEDPDISQEDVIAAASMANVHKFISSLPNGYETRVGDKGSQLSGGQKQRIAIARALIRKPKILLLDEATSALDSESEKLVQQAIDKASMGRTTITIAHRLSTIQNADQIAVVQNGKIVELGKHFELLDLNGLYADLVKQQDLAVH